MTEPDGYDDGYDDDRLDDDYEPCRGDDESEWRCVLGEKCLVADPFHHSSECFDAEWAEWYYSQANIETNAGSA